MINQLKGAIKEFFAIDWLQAAIQVYGEMN